MLLQQLARLTMLTNLIKDLFKNGHTHFQEMSGGDINATELVATLIDQKDNLLMELIMP